MDLEDKVKSSVSSTLVEQKISVVKTEKKAEGKTGVSYRVAPTPDIKGNRKKFNRFFRDKVKSGNIISLPDDKYGIYRGHAQGRKEIDRKTYYVLFSPLSDAPSKDYKKTAFSFPEEVVLKTGVFRVSYMGFSG